MQKLKATDNEENIPSCSMYLAPSSIPGGGLGIFTTKAVKEGNILHPADAPDIPIIDPDWSQKSKDAWVGLFAQYWYSNGVSDPTLFESEGWSADFQTGICAFPNTHQYLQNLNIGSLKIVPVDDSILNRDTEAGAGASSNHLGRMAIASRDIDAGEEILLQYPQVEMKRLTEEFNVPDRDDFNAAGEWLSNVLKLFENKHEIPWKRILDVSLFGEMTDRAVSLLPKSNTDLDNILGSIGEDEETPTASHFSLAIAKEMSVNKRSVEWIEENGFCMDNIVVKKSLNPHAGRGAFANRPLKKGDVIVPAPVLQINNKNALRMPAFEGRRKQLLLNYCFGHSESTMLLCPYSNANLLNHCSKRRPGLHPCGERHRPNAKLRWSKWDQGTFTWIEKSLDDIRELKGRVPLSLDVVATKNIQEGEELYLDYGEEWEDAWEDHLREWNQEESRSSDHGDDWQSLRKLNDELRALPLAPDFSRDEPSKDSSGLLFTACRYNLKRDVGNKEESFWNDLESELPWKDYSIEDTVSKFGTLANNDFDVDTESYRAYVDGSFWPCVVTKSKDDSSSSNGDDTYTVRILQSFSRKARTALWEERSIPRIITRYPRTSIRHFYLPHASDQHLAHAFRHPIGLRDEMFPEQWKDIKVLATH
jgi:hypothetical protein